ncbi:MAG: hypothetical protein RMI94_13670 [Bryobacterales bacterium]|nr:hypothetical protein [Bryobacterales bacterium]
MTNGAGHQCHAGTIEIERPIKDGIRFQAYSMLTRDIGRLEDGESPEDSNDRKRERAVRMDIPTHRLAANFVRELPMGEGHPLLAEAGRVLNALVSGWQVSAAYILRSGMFLTPRWTGPDPNGRRFTSSRPPPSVTLRPDLLPQTQPASSHPEPMVRHWGPSRRRSRALSARRPKA